MKLLNYEIIKVMNNNIILAKNLDDFKEQILVGKGLGFGVKSGQKITLDKNKIEKKFIALDQKINDDYFNLFQKLDPEIMEICENFIEIANKELGELNPHVHIALTDHIGFAIERINQNQEIINPFLYQIKALYKKEFEIAKQAKYMIEEKFNIKINESEVGFIALHLHSARKNRTINETVKYTRVLNECVEIIEENLHYTIDQSSLTYIRLISHLRSLIERVVKNQDIENLLLDSIKKEFKNSYIISNKVKKIIESNLNVNVSDEEIGYMTIHIDRVRRISEK